MSTVLIQSSPARSHLYPMMDVASAVRAAGHRVVVRTLAAAGGAARAVALPEGLTRSQRVAGDGVAPDAAGRAGYGSGHVETGGARAGCGCAWSGRRVAVPW